MKQAHINKTQTPCPQCGSTAPLRQDGQCVDCRCTPQTREALTRRIDKQTNEIVVEKRTVYGNDLFYPLNHVEALYALTKQKTLSLAHIKALRSMGFQIFQANDCSLLSR